LSSSSALAETRNGSPGESELVHEPEIDLGTACYFISGEVAAKNTRRPVEQRLDALASRGCA